MTGDVHMLMRCTRCWAREHLVKCENRGCPNFMCSSHNYGGRFLECWETESMILPP
jgi:hypothetical protein